jgi:adenosine/AMP kinase
MNIVMGGDMYYFTVTDLNGILKTELQQLQSMFNKSAQNASLNKLTRTHLQQMSAMIAQKFNADRSGLVK